MASFYLRDSAAWRKVQKLYLNDGAAWRNVKKLYLNDGSAWRLVFSGFQVSWSGTKFFEGTAVTPAAAAIYLYMNPDGTWQEQPDNITNNWGLPTQAGIGANYWIKFVQVSGTAVNTVPTMTANTWYSLNTQRRYAASRGSVGSTTSVVDISISTSASDAGIVGTCRVTLVATVDA